MICNPNNTKYKSALADLPFEARQIEPVVVKFYTGTGRCMESLNFSLGPVLRNPPDIDRFGRAILELALRVNDQDGGAS